MVKKKKRKKKGKQCIANVTSNTLSLMKKKRQNAIMGVADSSGSGSYTTGMSSSLINDSDKGQRKKRCSLIQ
jgi:hypothetical protein